jgi:hypothetical protein
VSVTKGLMERNHDSGRMKTDEVSFEKINNE